MKAYIGPAIGPECYRISTEEDPENRLEILARHLKKYPNIFKRIKKDRVAFDNKKANFYLLKEAGLVAKNIEIAPECTACQENLASHWAEGKQRQTSNLAVIGLAEK
jgi:copper oxidase (laccase) domain-containing protein